MQQCIDRVDKHEHTLQPMAAHYINIPNMVQILLDYELTER